MIMLIITGMVMSCVYGFLKESRFPVSRPITPIEPSCFSNVDGCPCVAARPGIGGANIGVGAAAVWCELKAAFAAPGTV
jgi:hypothetical protein